MIIVDGYGFARAALHIALRAGHAYWVPLFFSSVQRSSSVLGVGPEAYLGRLMRMMLSGSGLRRKNDSIVFFHR